MAALTGTALAAEVTAPGGIKLTENGNEWTVTGHTGGNEVTIPATYEGKPVTAIGSGAFENKGVTRVTIPSGIKTIGTRAFFGTKIQTLEIPGTVTTIESQAFEQCSSLKSVTFVDPAKSGGSTTTTIGVRAFATCEGLTTLKLTGSVSGIGQEAFLNCGMSQVIIWPGTNSVGKDAFSMCDKLTKIVIADSAAAASRAFTGCKNLDTVHYGSDTPPAEESLPDGFLPEKLHKVNIERSIGTATCTESASIREKSAVRQRAVLIHIMTPRRSRLWGTIWFGN